MAGTRTAALTGIALALIACGDSATKPADTAHGGGTSRILLTDDPFPYDRVAHVNLYIVSISGSVTADTGATAGGFVTLAEPHRRIDVLSLQNGLTEELGTVRLAPGAITAMRMVIDTDSSSIALKDGRVLTGGSSPGIAWQSSAGRPVLNAIMMDQIQVPDSGAVAVVVYDVGEAFLPDGAGFIFSPVFRAADATRSGSISGAVRARTSDGAPLADASLQLYIGQPGTAENTWPRIATARTSGSGEFKFAFVPRSAFWEGTAWKGSTYKITVDPPANVALTRALVDSIAVLARENTSVGTVVLP